MIINHNMAAANTYRQLSINNGNTGKALEKLSSGLRINKAGDDAAGLAISEKMRGQIRGLDQASRNSQDAISLIQTAEGSLNETHSILQRMRELAVQSASDTATSTDRSEIQKEVDELAKEVTRISNTSEFNTKNLMAGGFSSTFQIGANKDQNVSLSISAMDAQSLGVAGALTTTTFTPTNSLVTSISTTSSNLNGTYLNVSKAVATYGAIAKSDADTTATFTTSLNGYTGSADATYQIRIDTSTAAGTVTAASYTTNGGVTWSNAAVTAGASSQINAGNGVILDVLATTANDVAGGDTYTFTATAQRLHMQIGSTTTGGTSTGTAVKVTNNQSSVTIGDAASDKTVTINFNFATVFDGSATGTYAATSGTYNALDSDLITQTQTNSTAATTGADGSVSTNAVAQKGINVSSQGAANNAITTINTAITTVSAERSKLGAMQNRLEHTIANLGTSSENLTSAESRIRDVDMAKEMMNFQKNNILSQAAQAMLAQANQQPQGVLQLLR